MIRIASTSSSSRSRIVRLVVANKGNYYNRSTQVSSLLPNILNNNISNTDDYNNNSNNNFQKQQGRSISVMVGNNRRIQQDTNNGSNPLLLVSLASPSSDRRTFFSFSSSKNKDKVTEKTETTTEATVGTNDTDSFSTTDGDTNEPSNTIDVDDAINKLFEDSQQQQQNEFQAQQQDIVDKVVAADTNTSGDAWYAATVDNPAAYIDWTPVWYNLADQAVVCVKFMHEISGLEYGWTIVATTAVMRLVLFPVMVSAQRTTSRMAHVQPELNALKARFEALGTPSRQEQIQFVNNTKALFARYDVKPFRAFMAPLIQIPLFMSFFFGLRKMPHIYADEFSTAGMFWFVDLTVPDPYYILPIASSLTFLGLIELGKTQMMVSNPAQGQLMTNVFRAMALFMLPVCINFEASMLCYWTANNIMTVGQTYLLQQKSFKNYFGIWDPPKPVPGMPQPDSFMEAIQKLQKRAQGKPLTDAEAIKKHNATIDAKKTAIRMVRASRASRSTSSSTTSSTKK